ncbi:hypothetical protein ACJX0J_034058, partial [Zea mays]
CVALPHKGMHTYNVIISVVDSLILFVFETFGFNSNALLELSTHRVKGQSQSAIISVPDIIGIGTIWPWCACPVTHLAVEVRNVSAGKQKQFTKQLKHHQTFYCSVFKNITSIFFSIKTVDSLENLYQHFSSANVLSNVKKEYELGFILCTIYKYS